MKTYFKIKSLFLLAYCLVSGQNKSYIKGISVRPSYGFYWAHSSKISNVSAHAVKTEISLLLQTTGKENWHSLYGFPLLSVNFSHTYSNSSADILGAIYGLGTDCNLPLFRKGIFTQYFRFGTGLAYISKRFDPEKYPKNKVISTRLNGIMTAGLAWNFRVSSRFSQSFYLGLFHQSNGKFNSPNFGVNYVHFAWESNWFLTELPKEFKRVRSNNKEKSLWTEVRIAFGKKVKKTIFPAVLVNTFSAGLLKNVSNAVALTCGVDVFRDPSMRFTYENKVIEPWTFSAALRGGSKFLIGNVFIITEVGGYFLNNEVSENKSNFYQRLGFAYRLHPQMDLGLTLKTHFANADFLEWTMSFYPFRLK